MHAPTARVVAISAFVAIVMLAAAEVWMILATLDRPTPDQWGFRGFEAALAVSFGSVGVLVAVRRPEHPIGWLALGLSVVTGVEGIVDQYPVLADAANPPLPFAGTTRWIAAWIWVIPSAGFVSFFPLIFPNGRLLSSRWRLAVLFSLVAMAVLIGSIILASRPFGPLPPTTNPAPYFERLGAWMLPGYLLYLAAVGVAVTSAFLRYRRAGGEERQQIKWVAYAAVLLVPGAALGVSPLFFGQVLFIAVSLFAAAAVGIAILRYRLYEIDIIINRTIVYGVLSAVLAGIYTASITLSQRLFMAITGERSDAAIVLTTLIVASTFTPIKTRLQAVVDRRVKPVPSPDTASPDVEAMAAVLATAEDRFRQIARDIATEEIARAADGGSRRTG